MHCIFVSNVLKQNSGVRHSTMNRLDEAIDLVVCDDSVDRINDRCARNNATLSSACHTEQANNANNNKNRCHHRHNHHRDRHRHANQNSKHSDTLHKTNIQTQTSSHNSIQQSEYDHAPSMSDISSRITQHFTSSSSSSPPSYSIHDGSLLHCRPHHHHQSQRRLIQHNILATILTFSLFIIQLSPIACGKFSFTSLFSFFLFCFLSYPFSLPLLLLVHFSHSSILLYFLHCYL